MYELDILIIKEKGIFLKFIFKNVCILILSNSVTLSFVEISKWSKVILPQIVMRIKSTRGLEVIFQIEGWIKSVFFLSPRKNCLLNLNIKNKKRSWCYS